MKYTFLVLIALFSSKILSQDFKPITEKMLQCAEGEEELLVLSTAYQNDTFQWIWPTDICENVHNKTKVTFAPEQGFIFCLNKQKHFLSLKESYHSLLPQGIYFGNHLGKKFCVIEFILLSHIALSGYNYLIIDYSNVRKIITKEINSKSKILLTNLIPKK